MKKEVNFLEAVKQTSDFTCVETGAKYRITDNGDVIILNSEDQFLDYVTFNTELMREALFLVDVKVSNCDTCKGSRFEKYIYRGENVNRLCSSCGGDGKVSPLQ